MVLYWFVRTKHVSKINALCTMYVKDHIFEYKVKATAFCCFFRDHVLVTLLKANKIC